MRLFKILLMLVFLLSISIKTIQASDLQCGIPTPLDSSNTCSCESGFNEYTIITGGSNTKMKCCGWVRPNEYGNECFSTSENEEDLEEEPNPADGGDSILELTSETFDSLNPLKITGSSAADELSTPGGIVSRLLNFLFPLAGLALFFLISWGGFEILIGATDQKGMEAGKNRITAAIVGFILLFSSYWLTQIVEVIFGISIL